MPKIITAMLVSLVENDEGELQVLVQNELKVNPTPLRKATTKDMYMMSSELMRQLTILSVHESISTQAPPRRAEVKEINKEKVPEEVINHYKEMEK